MIRNPLVAAALAALVAAGCSPQVADPPCPAGKLCMHSGNTAEPNSLDPHKASLISEDTIISEMLVGLFYDDAEAKPIPGMATSWTTSADGKVWTLQLREATWSDGVPVTADDFVYAVRRLMNPKTAGEYASLQYVIKGAEAANSGKGRLEDIGIRALGPRTLEITFNEPVPFLPELATHFTLAPVPRHVVEKYGDDWVQPGKYVGNGPYVLAESRLGDYVRLVKNPRFYDAGNVCLDELYFYPTRDAIAAERRIKRGELHFNNDIQSNRIAFLRRPEQIPAYVRTGTRLGIGYLAFNNAVPAFRDARVRHALSMAIDREFITGGLMRGGQIPAYSFTPPGTSAYPGGAKPYWAGWSLERRQAEARRLLAAAGFGPDRPLKVDIKHRNTPDPMLFMPAIQADWRQIGVETQLTQNEAQIAYAAYRARDFNVADAAWIADYNDAMSFLYLMESTTGAQNYGDYKNPRYDALMAAARAERDAGRRAALMLQGEQLMLDEAAVAPVYFYASKNLVSPRLTGFKENVVDEHRRRWMCFRDADSRRATGEAS